MECFGSGFRNSFKHAILQQQTTTKSNSSLGEDIGRNCGSRKCAGGRHSIAHPSHYLRSSTARVFCAARLIKLIRSKSSPTIKEN